MLVADPLPAVALERVASEDGLAAGLAAALDGVDADCAPGPVAALPTSWVPVGAPVIAHRVAASLGISFVRCTPRPDAAHRRDGLAARLAGVRIGVSATLVDHATRHLAGRESGGEPLLRKQILLGTLADLRLNLHVLRQTVAVAGVVPSALVDVHDRLTAADWEAAKLLGASGFVAGSPAWDGYVSRLVAHCWLDRAGAPCPR